MKIIRWILGKILLLLDALFAPTPQLRNKEDLDRIHGLLAGATLYQFEACPFCIKVRRYLRASGISIPLRDAKEEPGRSELLAGGGKLQVPCLRIVQSDNSVQWLYESADIIAYLQGL